MLKNRDVTNLNLEKYKRQKMHTSSALPTAPCSVDLTIKQHIIAYILYCMQILKSKLTLRTLLVRSDQYTNLQFSGKQQSCNKLSNCKINCNIVFGKTFRIGYPQCNLLDFSNFSTNIGYYFQNVSNILSKRKEIKENFNNF